MGPTTFEVAIAYIDAHVVVGIIWCPFLKHTLGKPSIEYQLSFVDGVGGIFERLAAQSCQSNILL